MAELRFFGYLSEIAGMRTKVVALDRPARLRDMIPPSFPEKNIIILINEKPASLDSVITNRDTVVLMPILSGG